MEKLYDKAYNWIFTMGPRFIVAVIVVIIGFWFIRILKRWMNNHMIAKEFDPSLRPFLSNLIIIALQVLLILGFMQILGIQMTIFAAVIGAFGVAAGLALSGTLQNFTSGVLILLLKPFRVGEIILAQGQEGVVTTIQIFFTTVTTFDNKTVIIPNSKLSNEVIINLSREGTRRIDIELKFNYGIPFEQIQTIIQRSILKERTLLAQPAARIGVASVDPDGYKALVNVWVQANQFSDTKMILQQHIIDDLKSAGIKLPGM